jgi:hypothetical protein
MDISGELHVSTDLSCCKELPVSSEQGACVAAGLVRAIIPSRESNPDIFL